MTTNMTVIAMLALVVSGCGREPEPSGSRQPAPTTTTTTGPSPSPQVKGQVTVSPGDLHSDTGTSPLSLLIDNGNPIDDATIKNITNTVMLTEIGGQVVDFDLLVTNNTQVVAPPSATDKGTPPQPAAAPRVATVLIVPRRGLNKQWHALRVGPFPPGFGAPIGSKLAQDGTLTTRFNPGSAPVVQSIAVCKKPDATRVYVTFSEGVQLAADTTNVLTVLDADAGSACPTHSANSDGGPSMSSYSDCGLDAFNHLIHVAAAGVISTPSGVALMSFSASVSGIPVTKGPVAIGDVPAGLTPSADGCRRWSP